MTESELRITSYCKQNVTATCSSITHYWVYRFLGFVVINDYINPVAVDKHDEDCCRHWIPVKLFSVVVLKKYWKTNN